MEAGGSSVIGGLVWANKAANPIRAPNTNKGAGIWTLYVRKFRAEGRSSDS